jgi:hypothetical protein
LVAKAAALSMIVRLGWSFHASSMRTAWRSSQP